MRAVTSLNEKLEELDLDEVEKKKLVHLFQSVSLDTNGFKEVFFSCSFEREHQEVKSMNLLQILKCLECIMKENVTLLSQMMLKNFELMKLLFSLENAPHAMTEKALLFHISFDSHTQYSTF